MKTNTVRQRLRLYRKALEDYKKNNVVYVGYGFCFYFFQIHDLDLYNKEIEELLPELARGHRRIDGNYWFKEYGATRYRIKALEKAIQRCEEQLKS